MTFLRVGSQLATVSGSAVQYGPSWETLAAFTHAGTAADSVLYAPSAQEQSDYGVSSTQRVATGRDRFGGKHLLRDIGVHAASYDPGKAPLPGPAYIPSSNRFRGLPAWHFDALSTGRFAMLTPVTDFGDTSTFMNAPNGYAAPWATVHLARFTGTGGTENASWDDVLGSSNAIHTIAAGNQLGGAGNISIANWTNFNPGPTITTGVTASADMTFGMIVQCVAGTNNSSVTVVYRDVNGTIVVNSTTGTLNANAIREFFFGWVHQSYLAAWGVKSSTFSFNESFALIDWMARWIPAVSSLSSEP